MAQNQDDRPREEIIAALTHQAFTGMSKFLRVDDQGQPERDFRHCTAQDMDRLAEYRITIIKPQGARQKGLVSFKLKMKDRMRALDALGSSFLEKNKRAAPQRTPRF